MHSLQSLSRSLCYQPTFVQASAVCSSVCLSTVQTASTTDTSGTWAVGSADRFAPGTMDMTLNAGEDWTSAERRLLCAESLMARRATVCCHDGRVLHQLLHVDDRYVVSANPYVNSNITVRMRTQLAEWIYQVASSTIKTCLLGNDISRID